mgnify:CR=1 FL=1
MCDETFSVNYVADVPAGVDRGWFMFFVTLLDQFYWVAGATLGELCGSLITFNTKGLDFVMTALFAVIFFWTGSCREKSIIRLLSAFFRRFSAV